MTKSKAAYEKIKEEILNGTLPPGSKLVISKLAKTYELSTMPVREALRLLEQEGLVVSEPNVGARVAFNNYEEHLARMLNRTALESRLIRVCAWHITDETIETLEVLQTKMSRAAASMEYLKYTFLEDQFFEKIFRSIPFEEVVSAWSETVQKTKIYNIFRFNMYTALTPSLGYYEQLLEALKARSPQRCAEAYKSLQLNRFEALEQEISFCIENANARLPKSFFITGEDQELDPEVIKQKLDWFYQARKCLI